VLYIKCLDMLVKSLLGSKTGSILHNVKHRGCKLSEHLLLFQKQLRSTDERDATLPDVDRRNQKAPYHTAKKEHGCETVPVSTERTSLPADNMPINV
jgi:hypothetical protein